MTLPRQATAQRRAFVLLVVGVLVLGACASSSGVEAHSGDGLVVDETNGRNATANENPAEGKDSQRSPPISSPLEELLGVVDSASEGRAIMEVGHIAQQNLIAACMAEQGFTYLPLEILMPPDPAAQSTVPLDTRAYAERYGFGIAAGHGHISEESRPLDPNDELLAEMSAAGRAAWRIALEGDPQSAEEWANWEMRGCWGKAMLATGSVMQANDEWASFRTELERFMMSIYDDPQVLALDAEWASCMIDAGQPGLNRPGFFGVNLTLRDEWFNNGLMNAEPSDPRVLAFADREIAAAVADWDCREALNYEVEFRAIQVALHAQFVETHRAELEGWALLQAENREAIQENAGLTVPLG